jgi:GNAT superfamily N-acetyltransferase
VPLGEKISYCERLYESSALPVLFRITPFSQPQDLDAELGRRGYEDFDATSVEAMTIDPAKLNGASAQPMDLSAWCEAVGELRGSPIGHRSTHFARLEGMPLPKRAVAIKSQGRVLATGLAILEGDCAGLFDIVTREDARRQGYAKDVVASLLRLAWDLGARHAYLQVQEDNESARRLYAQFGFAQTYRYWYRGRPGEER